jgi:hypothetical protein
MSASSPRILRTRSVAFSDKFCCTVLRVVVYLQGSIISRTQPKRIARAILPEHAQNRSRADAMNKQAILGSDCDIELVFCRAFMRARVTPPAPPA